MKPKITKMKTKIKDLSKGKKVERSINKVRRRAEPTKRKRFSTLMASFSTPFRMLTKKSLNFIRNIKIGKNFLDIIKFF